MSYGSPRFFPASRRPSLRGSGKPLGIYIAQIFFWFCCGVTFAGCCTVGLIATIAGGGLALVDDHLPRELSGVGLWLMVIPLVYIALGTLYGVLALHLGRGNRWAQVTTVCLGVSVGLAGLLAVVALIAGLVLGVDQAADSDLSQREIKTLVRFGGAFAGAAGEVFLTAFWGWLAMTVVPTIAVLTPGSRDWFR